MEGTQFIIVSVGLLIGILLVSFGALSFIRSRRKQDDSDDDLSIVKSSRPVERSSDGSPGWLNALKQDSPPETSSATAESTVSGTTQLSGETTSNFNLRRRLPPDTIVLARDAGTGEWLVEVDGQRYRRLSDIHDDKAASKILSAIEGMKAFAGLSTQSTPEPTRPAASTPSSAQLPPVVRRSGQASYPAPEGSIIAQIEVILQRELALHADVAHRHIHMGVAPDGSLLIEIDTNFYKSPDEIPDRRVHDLVKFAVHTWEKSN